MARDRDADDRPRNARPRDGLGRPIAYGADGVARQPEGVSRTPAQTIAEATRLLGSGRPFHAHEVFEDAWKSDVGGTREFWRGLAQLAVGVTHAARGNRSGAVSLLRRASATIEPFAADSPFGMDVVAVRHWVDEAVRAVEAQCPTVLSVPPFSPDCG